MELVHKQPVRWTHDRIVACDGGGGPHGHPRIFINTDKPEIAACNYCGLPYVRLHHRARPPSTRLHGLTWLTQLIRPTSITASTSNHYRKRRIPSKMWRESAQLRRCLGLNHPIKLGLLGALCT